MRIWQMITKHQLSQMFKQAIALKKCKKECDKLQIILVQGFCPLITQFPVMMDSVLILLYNDVGT